MGRPRLIETEEILKAARDTFLAEGVGATTAAIARRAGISEATIFKRFPTKKDLFFAAMEFAEFDARQTIEDLRGKGPASREIEAISLRFLAYLNQMVPVLTRLLAHPGFDAAELAERYPEMPARALVEATAEYVESEQRDGRIGPCDPHAVAITIFGILHNFALLEHIGLLPKDDRSRKTLVRSFIDVLWNGIKPEDARPTRVIT
ncbi:MAG: TetR/AcrR family transcriptional regulator [Myxococcota bacterium]